MLQLRELDVWCVDHLFGGCSFMAGSATGKSVGWLAFLATTIVLSGGAPVARADYESEVLADDPALYWRLDEEAGALDAENLGSALDGSAEYHFETELEVPGLIASDPGNNAARFIIDAADDASGLHVTDSVDLNTGGPYVEKSIILWFQADDVDPVEEQVLWEQGGSTRGINMYIAEGAAYVGAWNRASDGPGAPWESGDDDPAGGNVYISTPVNRGEIYMLALVMNGDDIGTEGTLTGYLNGQAFGEKTGVGQIYNHGDDAGIGHVHQNTYFQSGNWNNGNGMYFGGVIDEVAQFNTALPADRILALYQAGGGSAETPLEAGDANMDYQFDQLDLVKVQVAAKYLTGQAATWGEGDWDAAPGGKPGDPPPGNGFFDQLDIIAALGNGLYLQGPYGAAAGPAAPGGEATMVPGATLQYVPEPSTIVLLAFGLLATLGVYRRR
jgi:hypothetical protein